MPPKLVSLPALILPALFAVSACAENGADPIGEDWKSYCELFPSRCEALRKQCTQRPDTCENAKAKAAERKAAWEQKCEQNPERCEARKKRRMEAMSHCKDDPEACAADSAERKAAMKEARNACADFVDETERKRCIAHRMKKDAADGGAKPEAQSETPVAPQ